MYLKKLLKINSSNEPERMYTYIFIYVYYMDIHLRIHAYILECFVLSNYHHEIKWKTIKLLTKILAYASAIRMKKRYVI